MPGTPGSDHTPESRRVTAATHQSQYVVQFQREKKNALHHRPAGVQGVLRPHQVHLLRAGRQAGLQLVDHRLQRFGHLDSGPSRRGIVSVVENIKMISFIGILRIAFTLTVVLCPFSKVVAEEKQEPSAELNHTGSVLFEIGSFFRLNQLSTNGLKIGLGYDHDIIEHWLTLGPRLGMLENGGTITFVGLRGLFWTGKPQKSSVRFKLGIAIDVWINLAGDDLPEASMYFGGETGLCVRLSDILSVDFPVEVGLLPFFSSKMLVLQVGSQLVASF